MSVIPPYGGGERQLFNVVNDRAQTDNLAKVFCGVLQRFRSARKIYANEVAVVN